MNKIGTLIPFMLLATLYHPMAQANEPRRAPQTDEVSTTPDSCPPGQEAHFFRAVQRRGEWVAVRPVRGCTQVSERLNESILFGTTQCCRSGILRAPSKPRR